MEQLLEDALKVDEGELQEEMQDDPRKERSRKSRRSMQALQVRQEGSMESVCAFPLAPSFSLPPECTAVFSWGADCCKRA